MPLGEFDLISKYFMRSGTRLSARTALGIGDDCALLVPATGMQFAVSCDMLVEGRHFLSTVAPERLGHKALAVNLSDLAACGAKPLAFTLALAMPRVDERFLAGFSRGLFALADRFGVELVGGDTTAGPLNICITVFGEVPPGQALLRSGAQAGDELWVSHAGGGEVGSEAGREPGGAVGGIGDARLALEAFRGRVVLGAEAFEATRRAMECPEPRVALGLALRGLASAAIDISDGLAGDLDHVLAASGVGARVDVDELPRSAWLAAMPRPLQLECLLAGGDDYELLFSAPASHHARVLDAAAVARVGARCIGSICRRDTGPRLRLHDAHGEPVELAAAGFDHFRS